MMLCETMYVLVPGPHFAGANDDTPYPNHDTIQGSLKDIHNFTWKYKSVSHVS